ncbi:hypothetical protein FHS40_007370 [Streptomyces spectabilis]|uniref:Uncharacterized protein n=1 Tax=Streptomyces spectabilis TaxID=68270 RepID=A0A7W8B0U3_STRST|nr:hypothetical protein [Streptomyces spectabilis]
MRVIKRGHPHYALTIDRVDMVRYHLTEEDVADIGAEQ